jgi:hypothetical protein
MGNRKTNYVTLYVSPINSVKIVTKYAINSPHSCEHFRDQYTNFRDSSQRLYFVLSIEARHVM